MNPTVVAIISALLTNLPQLIAEVQAGASDLAKAPDTQAKVSAVLADAGQLMITLSKIV